MRPSINRTDDYANKFWQKCRSFYINLNICVLFEFDLMLEVTFILVKQHFNSNTWIPTLEFYDIFSFRNRGKHHWNVTLYMGMCKTCKISCSFLTQWPPRSISVCKISPCSSSNNGLWDLSAVVYRLSIIEAVNVDRGPAPHVVTEPLLVPLPQ